MAKQKKEVVIKVIHGGSIQIWANNLSVEDVMSIEGITNVLSSKTLPWTAYADARYDAQEIAKELEELLEASIPDIFRE